LDGYVYVANYNSHNVTAINPRTEKVAIPSIPVGAQPNDVAFDPANGNVYVTNVASADLTVIDGVTGAIALSSFAVGQNPFEIAFDPVNGDLYVTHELTKVVSVILAETRVTIGETGLAAGASWSAVFGGVQETTSGTTLNFTVIPGTYAFQVGPAAGETPSPGQGTVFVGPYPYAIAVTFSSLAPAPTQVSVGGYSEGLTVAAAVAATALGFGVAALVLPRRPPQPPKTGSG
jgi:YVTN family beta-propeller protein